MADWDSFSQDYDRIFKENPLYLDSIARLVGHLEDRTGMAVLDLGCGTGNVSAAVLERFPSAHVRGVDPSEGMRAQYAERLGAAGDVEVKIGDALGIPYDRDSFDFLVTQLALHHVPPEDRGRCAAELARVLKPGGRLVYADMFTDVDGEPFDPERSRDIINKMTAAALFCLDHGAYEMMQIMLATLPRDLSNEGEYMTTEAVWREALEGAGFEVLEVETIPPVEIGMRIIVAELPSI
ncbi:MAG: class I SAM-dependent methyltransferase [Actinomycetota bacterium]